MDYLKKFRYEDQIDDFVKDLKKGLAIKDFVEGVMDEINDIFRDIDEISGYLSHYFDAESVVFFTKEVGRIAEDPINIRTSEIADIMNRLIYDNAYNKMITVQSAKKQNRKCYGLMYRLYSDGSTGPDDIKKSMTDICRRISNSLDLNCFFCCKKTIGDYYHLILIFDRN